jgi:AsmA protein
VKASDSAQLRAIVHGTGASGKLGSPRFRSNIHSESDILVAQQQQMKNFLKAVLALVLIFVIGVVILISRINTEGNKQRLAAAFQEATGYELVIGGDLSLDFFPTLGVSLDDVRLRNPAVPQELASTSRAVLRVPLAPLMSGEINVQEISANDFHINYFVDANGKSIWELDASPADNDDENTGDIGSDQGSSFNIERIQISNASIDMQDLSQGTRYRIDSLNIDSRNTNIDGRPFSIDVNFDYESNGMAEPIPVNIRSEITADLDAGSVQVADLQFSVTPMLVTGEIGISDLNDAMRYSGNLAANDFDALALLQSLGLAESTSTTLGGINADRMLSFAIDFDGDTEQVSVPEFSMNLAGASIDANADIRMATSFAPMSVSYNLNAGDLDLSPFIPEAESSESANEATGNPAAQYQPETEVPVDLLNELSLLGSISIASITANEYRLNDVNLFTNIEDGVLDVEMPPVSAFEGTLQGTLRLDARAVTPVLDASVTTDSINLANLAPALSRFSTVTGFLQSESTYTAEGTTVSALMNSITGSTAYNISDNSVDIGIIKQVFTAIAALSPRGEAIQQWPDVIRFVEMSGYFLLDGGLESDQQLQLRMDNFDISGTGGIDLEAGTFDYDLAFSVLGAPYTQTIPINELYHNVSWPVDCSAEFSADISRYCRPDFARVREIFTQIGTNAARNRIEEAITDQVPQELQDTARGLLRNLLNN